MAYKYLMILIATCTTVVYFIPYACNDFYNHFIDTYHITYGQAGDLLTFFGITAVIGSVLPINLIPKCWWCGRRF